MKKSAFLLLVLLIFSAAGLSHTQLASVPAWQLESFVRRMCPMYNITRGSWIEERFHITEFRDGKWTCDDRAELAKRLARQYGYETSYGIDKTSDPNIFHRYVNLTDEDGRKYQIMRWRRDPAED